MNSINSGFVIVSHFKDVYPLKYKLKVLNWMKCNYKSHLDTALYFNILSSLINKSYGISYFFSYRLEAFKLLIRIVVGLGFSVISVNGCCVRCIN